MPQSIDFVTNLAMVSARAAQAFMFLVILAKEEKDEELIEFLMVMVEQLGAKDAEQFMAAILAKIYWCVAHEKDVLSNMKELPNEAFTVVGMLEPKLFRVEN